MRTVTYGLAVSLDWFLSGADGINRLVALQQRRAGCDYGILEER
jgi:hypothetical protein